LGLEPECGVDRCGLGVGDGGFAYVQGAAVRSLEAGGDAPLSREGFEKGCPTGVDAVGFEFPAQELHALVGQYRDPQVGFGAVVEVVVDRAQPEFGFQAAEWSVSWT
jgi:hypothetical protein